MTFRHASLMWTASAAGWFVLGCLWELPEAFIVSGTSLFVSWVFHDLSRP